MSTRTGIATLTLAALFAALIAWLLVTSGGHGVAMANKAPERATSAPASEPSMPVERSDEPARRDATPPTAVASRDDVALHVPDYGAALLRPAARAEFELRDAHGQPLEGAVLVGAELWRRIGDEWVEHEPILERQRSRIVCAGPSDSGLPPGEYELDVRAGPYGALREPFTLARGQALWRTLTLPHWRRIARLHLEDSRGQPLARVTQAPDYVFAPVELAAKTRALAGSTGAAPSSLMFAVAKSAPASAMPFAFQGSRLGWEAFYETDDGSFYVRVFAGLPAKLKLDLEADRYGQRGFAIESDFSGPEWDGYPIAINPLRGLDERMASWVDVNAGDPGSKSLLRAPINALPGDGDPSQLGDLLPGYLRIVIGVDAPIAVHLRSEAGTPRHVRGELLDQGSWHAGDVWYMDVMKGADADGFAVRYAFGDGFLLDVEAPLLELEPETLASPSFETHMRIDATPTVIEIVPPTPTLAAYARAVSLSLEGGSAVATHSVELTPAVAGSFEIRTALTAEVAEALFEEARLALAFKSGAEEGYRVARALDADERQALVHGGLRPELRGGGLVLRAVDRDATGMPGVFVALVSEAKLEIAQQLRRSLESGDAEAAMSPAEAARQVAASGDWFKAENVAHSDRDGYVLDDRIQLAPSRHYALFCFWSSNAKLQSQRIDFVATPGITDLGAVQLATR